MNEQDFSRSTDKNTDRDKKIEHELKKINRSISKLKDNMNELVDTRIKQYFDGLEVKNKTDHNQIIPKNIDHNVPTNNSNKWSTDTILDSEHDQKENLK